ncbi:hypothetical protein FF38_04049 [Lucilia cuprina]|uniref:Uncharacterized protein n=1 Tax=Lucilia cuprina TaxID=7375 RepID=A0A0L0CI79_LUCCU|nr:hypothetical protein FF38_04049 [Lucilia cuprina]
MCGRGKGGKVKSKAKSLSNRAGVQFPVGLRQLYPSVQHFFSEQYISSSLSPENYQYVYNIQNSHERQHPVESTVSPSAVKVSQNVVSGVALSKLVTMSVTVEANGPKRPD